MIALAYKNYTSSSTLNKIGTLESRHTTYILWFFLCDLLSPFVQNFAILNLINFANL